MITKSKIKEVLIQSGYRILKVVQYGVKTVDVATPFGEDSHPLKDMTAIFAETGRDGQPVIIGYVHKEKIADIGEKRIFSLKEDGTLSSYIHLKNDETINILGDEDFAVRFTELESGFNELRDDLNNFINKYNTHTHPANNTPTATTETPSEANIAAAKIETIRLP